MSEGLEPTVQIMIDKLEREIARLRTAKQPADAIDHATNGAVTAWQLADWIWKLHVKDNPETRSRLNLEMFTHIRELERDFKKKAIAQLSELQLCVDIANTFKHVSATTKPKHFGSRSTARVELLSAAKPFIKLFAGSPKRNRWWRSWAPRRHPPVT